MRLYHFTPTDEPMVAETPMGTITITRGLAEYIEAFVVHTKHHDGFETKKMLSRPAAVAMEMLLNRALASDALPETEAKK